MKTEDSKITFQSSFQVVNSNRLATFSDGVFAIAVTLLVFNLKIPEIPSGTVHSQLPSQLKAMIPHFLAYVISFFLVAINWTVHHRLLDLVDHVDINFIWLNLLYLLLIAFIPFLAGLIGTYPEEPFSLILYLSLMTLVILVSLAMWWYASHKFRLIHKNISRSLIKYFYVRAYITIAVFIVVLALTFFHIHRAVYCLLILVPVNWLVRRHHEKLKEI